MALAAPAGARPFGPVRRGLDVDDEAVDPTVPLIPMRWLLLRAGRTSIAAWLRAADADRGLETAARVAYDRLAARAPWPSNQRVLQLHLAFSVLPGAAIYAALLEAGRSAEEASEVVARALAAMALPRRRLYGHLARSASGRRLFMALAARSLRAFPAPGWQATWIERSPRRVAFDFTRCFDLDMLTVLDAGPIAPAYCAVDDVLYKDLCPRLGWARTGSLATGAGRCDFRFELLARRRSSRPGAGAGDGRVTLTEQGQAG